MATYYVRKTGSDANAGTSAGAAWLTLGKALGAAGATSGDTVYVGAGIYRENVTVAASPASTLSIIGDTDGAQTGDAGEVQWSAFTVNDLSGAPTTLLTLNAKDFLAFKKLSFIFGSAFAVDATTTTSTDVTFEDCSFLCATSNGNATAISVVVGAGVAANWTIDRCRFVMVYRNVGSGLLQLALNRHSADYNANILIRDSMLVGGGDGVRILSTGAGTGFGGGVTVDSCSITPCVRGVIVADANIATSIPCVVRNSLLYGGSTAALVATTLGQITETFNLLVSTTQRTNVTVGAGSPAADLTAALFHFGQERIWDGLQRPFMHPTDRSPVLGFGASSGPTVDLLNRPRSAGAGRQLASGTATAGAATTLTDSGATWGTNAFNGAVVRITGGTGSGQAKMVKSHTGTVLTLFGNWQTNPDNTSTYVIYFGNPTDCGTATAGAATTLTQASASWTTNMWTGYTLEITAGTGSGQTKVITSNTGTVITVPTWGTNPDNTSKFKIYRQTSETAVNSAAGALERHDSAERETGTTDAGGVAFRLTGFADQRILVPVDASSTTISIKARYDANHAATNKPQAVLLANGEIGVTAETKTMTSAADTWETLTFATQTPTAKGWVTIELRARGDKVYGEAFFDTLAVT